MSTSVINESGWATAPSVILFAIWHELNDRDLDKVARVCRQWRSYAVTDHPWNPRLKVKKLSMQI